MTTYHVSIKGYEFDFRGPKQWYFKIKNISHWFLITTEFNETLWYLMGGLIILPEEFIPKMSEYIDNVFETPKMKKFIKEMNNEIKKNNT